MTGNNDNASHLSEDDLVLFALQLLPEERMRDAMPHVQACPQCRSEVIKLQGDLAAYSTTAEPQAPPPSSRDRFMRQIAREPRVTELPAFQLAPTEFELRQQEREREREREKEQEREKERLAQLAPPQPQAAKEPPRNYWQEQASRQEQVAKQQEPPNARQDQVAQRQDPARLDPATPRQDPLQRRLKDLVEDRRDEHLDDRGNHPEPVFSARQSRNLGSGDHEHDEPVLSRRQSRNLRKAEVDEDDEDRFEEPRRPRRAPWVLAWTGWIVAAGCSFVAGLQLHQRQQMQGTLSSQQAQLDDLHKQAAKAQMAQTALSTLTSANAMQIALRATPAVKIPPAAKGAPPAVPPEALAAYMANKGALVFVVTHMQPAPAGKTYELWLIPADGQAPVPAGTFKPDLQGGASVVMPHIPTGIQAKGFGVTVENDGGSATPTMPLLMS